MIRLLMRLPKTWMLHCSSILKGHHRDKMMMMMNSQKTIKSSPLKTPAETNTKYLG